MTTDRSSLAALIAIQMGGTVPALKASPLHSAGADYLWGALGDALKRARVVSRLVVSLPEAAGAALCNPVASLEPA